MTPSLSSFIGDFDALSEGFLLPQTPRRRWRHWLGLLPAAAAVALGSAVLLVGAFTLSVQALLGPVRLKLAFPYLQPALDLFLTDRHWLLALLLTALSLAGLALQLAGMAQPLRRRWLALAALLSLLVLTTAVDVAFTEGNGAVMDALNRRSAGAFWGTAIGLVAIYLLTLPIQFLNTYGQQRFALAWRDASTGSLERGYLSGLTYYRLEAEGPLAAQVDNPDQRIAEDIQRSVASSTDLAFGFSASLLALAAYIVVLFGISTTLVVTLLVATLIGNGLIVKLVRRLSGLNFRQQALEAEFRFALVHIRNNAEKIAFFRGEPPIALELRRRFGRLLTNLERLIRWRALVDQSTGLYAFLMQFVPYLVLSVAYFSGRVSLGQLTVASIAFSQVQSSLSFLIDRADSFAGLFASLERIGSLSRVVGNGLETLGDPAAPRTGRAAPRTNPPIAGPASIKPAPDTWSVPAQPVQRQPTASPGAGTATPLLRLQGLTVTQATGGEALIRQLDLVMEACDRLLITGPSGCGKTSLLRVLSELTPAAAGSIERGDGLTMMVLPQAPYMTLGSLREQILFPGLFPGLPESTANDASINGAIEVAIDDVRLRAILRQVRLQTLEQRHPDLGEINDWSRVLSGGEQQRLGFARLLLHQPDLAVLDEATSALDLASETQLYGDLVARGCALISVGHRRSLRAFHQRELQLDGQGGWTLREIS
jgi:vitamin B12/bleomycin/antimicrobial peptide transport system ATP-binding/permease protein